MGGTGTHSFLWILVVGVCMGAAHTSAWGNYNCDVKEEGLQRIREICSEAISEARSPFIAIESKLDRVLEFVEEIKTAEDSWLHLSKKSDTVERDLTRHEEAKEDEKRDGSEVESDRSDDAIGSRGDLGYHWQDRRDRPKSYDRRNRRERTSDEDLHESVEKTDSVTDSKDNSTVDVQEEKKEEVEHSSTDTRRRPEAKDETGLKKGECSAITVNDHETIGMFYMMSYQHGHCTNRNPITEPIRYCLGYCATKTFLERESGLWSQGNDCKSCQPMNYETVRIPLTCDDGFVFEKKFENVVDCKCRGCSPLED
ncbi:uncharacterized protein [Palaemon carinicauda]|uniref:uncharacterized protein n=1 Tax=Palaemon carinicauda TaxID=392227 RepID=UPI0035B5994E